MDICVQVYVYMQAHTTGVYITCIVIYTRNINVYCVYIDYITFYVRVFLFIC